MVFVHRRCIVEPEWLPLGSRLYISVRLGRMASNWNISISAMPCRRFQREKRALFWKGKKNREKENETKEKDESFNEHLELFEFRHKCMSGVILFKKCSQLKFSHTSFSTTITAQPGDPRFVIFYRNLEFINLPLTRYWLTTPFFRAQTVFFKILLIFSQSFSINFLKIFLVSLKFFWKIYINFLQRLTEFVKKNFLISFI